MHTDGYNLFVFKNHHTNKYLIQCFFNLQEKYERGQKDFNREKYLELRKFVADKLKSEGYMLGDLL